jgi:hypothetical protein
MLENEAPRDFDPGHDSSVKVTARQSGEPDEDALAFDQKGTKPVVTPLSGLSLQPCCALLSRERATKPGHDALVHTESSNDGEIVAADGT